MNTAAYNNNEKKKKLIELPVDTCRKLAIQAAIQGKSLKKYIESLLITKGESVSINNVDNPSPSGDPWFVDSDNISIVMEGIKEYESGKTTSMTIEEIDKKLGL